MILQSGARVAIAGAGAFGSATALILSRLGFKVTVFDPAPPGENASGVAAGMLAPAAEAVFDAVSRGHLPVLRRARDLWTAFAQDVGIALDRQGLAIEGDEAFLAKVEAALVEAGARFSRTPTGLFSDEDWRLDARSALSTLRGAAIAAGADFDARGVAAFSEGRVTLDDGEVLAFDALVVATGGGGGQGLAPELAALTPIKGQILRLETAMAEGPVLRGQGVYIAPGSRPAVGATMEAGRDDREPDPAVVEPLRIAAERLRPELAGAPSVIEVGVRASTADGLPLVGKSRVPGVILAAGARRNGWLLAPLVADMVAAYLTDADPGEDAAAFDPQRFEG
ncbi:NAD(P)/FAD-dependent oxidoreductase [Caulobacter endophyticus]|uniref:NAD(P)/FAD-dependent oxidoreductase n=1 Tax=Caulobacter endophyticus TaxID=2172652 RepID=UPI00241078ED|nr:FAD-dependent oxidoreductase [Caulobacter endophyticus]MDG2531509.1 FAD-dependent oxidoreductase [Caulobacter endophyticus]